MMLDIRCLIHFSLFTICILLISCSINFNSINKEDIQKCNKCKVFLKEYRYINAPNVEYDEFKESGYWEKLTSTDSLSFKPKVNFIMKDKYQNISENLFCFIGMSKEDIEMRFDTTFAKKSHSLNQDNVIWSTSFSAGLGDYKFSNNDSTLVVYPGASFTFNYILEKGDTLYSGIYGDSFKFKECLEDEGEIQID